MAHQNLPNSYKIFIEKYRILNKISILFYKNLTDKIKTDLKPTDKDLEQVCVKLPAMCQNLSFFYIIQSKI